VKRATVADLVAGASLLRELGGSREDRRRWAEALCAVAGLADRRRAQTGRAHPLLGDGTLAGLAAGLRTGGEIPPNCSDREFVEALAALCAAAARRMGEDREDT
jgi:GAF domain-containing protein